MLAWATDIHLNFLEEARRHAFVDQLGDQDADALVISGDIGEAATVERFLSEIDGRLAAPIYFVLGNHDFYGGAIEDVRSLVATLAARSRSLVYLTRAEPIELTPTTCLIGHDGWADARLGRWEQSSVILNDYLLIEELAGLSKDSLRETLYALGDEAAQWLRAQLSIAVEQYQRIIVATHVPPFAEACWHQGRTSDDNWLPHFGCKAIGDVLRDAMSRHPSRQMVVLCGHCHGQGEAQILPNLLVLTGGAEYGDPRVNGCFTLA